MKVLYDLSEIFMGSQADLRRLTAVLKVFHCLKMSKSRGFWTKFGRGERVDPFSHVVSICKTSNIIFCELKKFYVNFRRSPATYRKLKTDYFFKNGKKWRKKLIFLSNNMHVEDSKTFYILFSFTLSKLKLKFFCQFYINEALL